MLNVCAFMGRLTADPELRQTTAGKEISPFRVAVEAGKNKDGEKQTDFINCVAFGSTAKFIVDYFSKGQMIAASGSIHSRSYKDRSGQNRSTTEIIVDKVFFCGDKYTLSSDSDTYEDLLWDEV